MKELNVFDFDGTIYDGDSTINFYMFCLRKNLLLIRYLPIQIYGAILYVLKIKPKEYFKEKFFSFLKGVKNVDNEVQEFWEKEYRKIKLNLIEGKENLVVISASPEFLLNPICKKLKVEKLIASKVNKSTGKYIGKNCYGKEKVNRLNSEYEKYIIKEFYSDSQSDKYLAEIAEKSFIVNRDKITQQ